MKQLGLFCVIWLACANAQLIFPDQLTAFQASYPNDLSPRPFPPLPDNIDFIDPPSIILEAPGSWKRTEENVTPGPSAISPTIFPKPANTQLTEGQQWSNHVNNLIARGVTKFTLDMDRAIYRTQKRRSSNEKENIVFSPLSLVGTLAMVLLGSAGTTFDEVTRILGLEVGVDVSRHSEIVHRTLGLLLASVLPKPNITGPQANIANGIFVQNGYPIRSEFEVISREAYNNEVINLDFTGHPLEARRRINDWFKIRTNGKITDILSDVPNPETVMIIASALYFSGEWNKHFYSQTTRREPFMVTPTQTVEVDMMFVGGEFSFYEDRRLGVKIVALPYKGNDSASSTESDLKYQAVMYVLLPTSQDEDALINLKERLTPEIIDSLIAKMVRGPTIIGMPRMALESRLQLRDALKSLGLVSLFDERASNLGILSPGRASDGDSRPTISSRFGDDDEIKNSSKVETENRYVDPATKNNYFRYEDKKGGYNVEQWNNGVRIEKIRTNSRRRRSSTGRSADNANRRVRRLIEDNDKLIDKTTDRVKFVPTDNGKYKSASRNTRSKRQIRPIDDSFVQFLRTNYGNYDFSLDNLRNGNNIGNPGLFASDVVQEVKIDITEKGTVAAAATVSLFQKGGDIKRLVAERPFLFFIRHEPSKLIMFWGNVNKPTPSYRFNGPRSP